MVHLKVTYFAQFYIHTLDVYSFYPDMNEEDAGTSRHSQFDLFLHKIQQLNVVLAIRELKYCDLTN
jgi:hypothetical protein